MVALSCRTKLQLSILCLAKEYHIITKRPKLSAYSYFNLYLQYISKKSNSVKLFLWIPTVPESERQMLGDCKCELLRVKTLNPRSMAKGFRLFGGVRGKPTSLVSANMSREKPRFLKWRKHQKIRNLMASSWESQNKDPSYYAPSYYVEPLFLGWGKP